MGNRAGAPRDFDTAEKRPFRAMQLWERRQNRSESARQPRFIRQTVARWEQQVGADDKSAPRQAAYQRIA